jgi:hypothetical protein
VRVVRKVSKTGSWRLVFVRAQHVALRSFTMNSKRREERNKDKDSKDSGEYIFTDLDAAFHLAENTDQTNFKYACAVCYAADIKNLMQRASISYFFSFSICATFRKSRTWACRNLI